MFILSGFQKVSVIAICVGGGRDMYIHWSLEGCPNTAVRLAGWKKMIQQGVILYVMKVYAACPNGPHQWPRSGVDLLLNIHKTLSWPTSCKEGTGPCLLSYIDLYGFWYRNKGFLWFKVHIWDEIYKIVNRVLIANLAFDCKKYRYDMLLLNYHMHHKKVTCHLKIFYLMTLLSSM